MKKLMCYFSHNVEIKGIYGDNLVLDGWCDDEEGKNERWGIVVDIKSYLEGIKQWMDDKRDYCDRYGYNCGQGVIMGECEGKEIELGGEIYIDCTNVEWEADLEHG